MFLKEFRLNNMPIVVKFFFVEKKSIASLDKLNSLQYVCKDINKGIAYDEIIRDQNKL